MQTPTGDSHFKRGTYANMWQLVDPSSWGSFDWSGDDRTCLSGTASVTVNSVIYAGDVMTGGGLSWSGDRRGCNMSIGWFVVDGVSYTDGVISALDMRFEQHCQGAAPALHGKIHWNGP